MTALVRNNVRDAFMAANNAHPGLLLQRGWTNYVKTDTSNESTTSKGAHLARICSTPASDFYAHAYDRWKKATTDATRFTQLAMHIKGRLLSGLTGGGALETGCAVCHTYGTPTIPGSSIKGVVRAWAEKNMPEWKEQFDDLFGTTDISGLVAFYDAWWIPDSGGTGHKNRPFAADIVTPHHPEYYKGQGAPATDLDSPLPNALIGVRGSFLFIIEGDAAWRGLAEKMLVEALEDWGVGTKTRAGYGYLQLDEKFKMARDAATKMQQAAQTFIRAKLSRNVGSGELKAILPDGKTTAPLRGAAAQAMLEKLNEADRSGKKIKEGKLVVDVAVIGEGKMIELHDVRPVQE